MKNVMTDDLKKILELAVVEQDSYDNIAQEMKVTRKQLSMWWEELKEEREKLSRIRKIWQKKCSEVGFWEFHEWYTNAAKECHYCHITETQNNELIKDDQIHSKRLSTRGRSLEIERLEPNKPYDDIENLVFSCYWCNNAKTDEFTSEEFAPIGKEIEKIWKSRLAK